MWSFDFSYVLEQGLLFSSLGKDTRFTHSLLHNKYKDPGEITEAVSLSKCAGMPSGAVQSRDMSTACTSLTDRTRSVITAVGLSALTVSGLVPRPFIFKDN